MSKAASNSAPLQLLHGILTVSLFWALPAGAAGTSQAGCLLSGCHSEISKHQVIHRPLKAHRCALCHFETTQDWPKNMGNKKEAHKKLIRFEGNKINATCLTCHDQIQEYLDEPKNPHKKIQEKACTFCHDPHGSEQTKLFKSDVFNAKCFACHEKLKKGIDRASSHHSPTMEGKACLNCHQFHHGKNPKLLNASPTQVCLDCHSKKITLKDGHELENIGERMKKFSSVHKPVRGKCASCHMPHGGEGEHLLDTGLPKEYFSKFDPSKYALCFDCHNQDLATAKSTKETQFRNGPANLHFLHIQRGDKGYGCVTCHDVHATEQPKLIRDHYVFQGVEVPMRFQTTANGGTCTSTCHGEKIYDREKAVQNESGR